MKVVILAGGLGTRLGSETGIKPKPMVEIGDYPIIWHIMKMYSHYGYNEFVVLTGYKHEMIKDYFVNYYMKNSDVTVDLASNEVEVHKTNSENWKITIVYTGKETLTGGRIKKAQPYVGNEPFLLTYGDGVSDVNIQEVVSFHKRSGKLCTVTAVQPEDRYGVLEIEGDNIVTNFQEKPKTHDSWINGGFFVCEPGVFDFIPDGDNAIWEKYPLRTLAKQGQLQAYRHYGFWHAMDTPKDKLDLNQMWESNSAPWAIWKR